MTETDPIRNTIAVLTQIDEATVHAARLKVCEMSESNEEAREMMLMLGLLK